MRKVILLETGNRFMWGLVSFCFLSSGLIHLFDEELAWYRILLGFLMIILGIYQASFSFFMFSEGSRYARRITVSDDEIELKNSYWSKAERVKWSQILSINLSNYRLDFKLFDSTYRFAYDTDAKTSRQVKQTIRKFAEARNISVTGG